MKKLIEVIENENGEISFYTDLNNNDMGVLQILPSKLAFNMMTQLWGGNETMVLAVIRNLAIADLAVSVNRSEMISFFDAASMMTANVVREMLDTLRRQGVHVQTVAPNTATKRKN